MSQLPCSSSPYHCICRRGIQVNLCLGFDAQNLCDELPYGHRLIDCVDQRKNIRFC